MNFKADITDPQMVDYQTRQLKQLISDLHNCCKDRIYSEAKMFKLPASELKCLLLFDGHKYLTAIEVANKLEVTKSRATVLIQNLEKNKHVHRTPNPLDARSKIISLTPTGHKKLQEVEDFAFHLHRQLLQKIAPEKRTDIIDALGILRSSMKSMQAQMKD